MKKLEYTGNKQAAYDFLDALDISQKWVIEARQFKELRTHLQNKLSHAWYSELTTLDDSDNAIGWKCYCKLHHGVLIMRRDDAEFKNVYDEVIKDLSYEKKLQVMKILPVTSLMNTAQLNEYLDGVQSDFANKGINLKYPEDYA
jgi:hypothetical protein